MHAVMNGNRMEDHILAYVFVSDTDIRVQGEVIEIDCDDAKGLKANGSVKINGIETRDVKFGDKVRYAFYPSMRKP